MEPVSSGCDNRFLIWPLSISSLEQMVVDGVDEDQRLDGCCSVFRTPFPPELLAFAGEFTQHNLSVFHSELHATFLSAHFFHKAINGIPSPSLHDPAFLPGVVLNLREAVARATSA